MSSTDYARVERAIQFIDAHAAEQPDLRRVAAEIGMSEFHFQRLFRRWAGISPKRFLQFITAGHAGRLLESRSTLDVSYEVGLSGTGRLHDLLVAVNAATPGEVRSGGAGLTIDWGMHSTPFGDCLIAVTTRGICDLVFLGEDDPEATIAGIASRWPAAMLREDARATALPVERIFAANDRDRPLTLLLRGTNFQLQVWRALLEIPTGEVTTYGAVARSIGAPTAARAVGSAIGANRVAYLIPCHRVIRGTPGFGQYQWGAARKQAILAWEALRAG